MVGGALLLTPAQASRASVSCIAWPCSWSTPPTASRCRGEREPLGGRALVVPDITVVRAAAAIGDRLFVDAADVLLAVEIATADTAVTDRITKPALYAEAGVPHLWCLDLEPAPHLYVGALKAACTPPSSPACRPGAAPAYRSPSRSNSTSPTSLRRPPADHRPRPDPGIRPRIADAPPAPVCAWQTPHKVSGGAWLAPVCLVSLPFFR
ncbi:Uma2 family endonuclease (plasmid) [Streptomyces acidiscabies]